MSFFLFFSLLESFGAESLFPPVEEEGEEDGYGPVGYGVGDVGFGSSVVESREDVGFGEHVDDFNGEYQGEEFDGLQVVGEEGRHGYDEGLGEDDAGEGAEWGHAHGDGCFVLPVVDGAERSSEVFRLVDGVVKDECGVNGPVGADVEEFHGVAQDRREEGREEVGQRVVDDEKLHDARYASEEGNENGEETVHDDVLAADADECNHGAQKDAEEKADECHEEGIRDGFGDEEEGGRYDSKVYHYVVLLPLSVMRCVAWNTISTKMTSTQ